MAHNTTARDTSTSCSSKMNQRIAFYSQHCQHLFAQLHVSIQVLFNSKKLMTDVNNNNLGVLLTAGRNLKCHVSLHLSFTLRCVVKGGESLFYLAIPLTGCFGSTRILKTHTPSYSRGGEALRGSFEVLFFFIIIPPGFRSAAGWGGGREVENNAAESFIRHPSSRPPSRPPPSRPPPPPPRPPRSPTTKPRPRRRRRHGHLIASEAVRHFAQPSSSSSSRLHCYKRC